MSNNHPSEDELNIIFLFKLTTANTRVDGLMSEVECLVLNFLKMALMQQRGNERKSNVLRKAALYPILYLT